MFPTFKRSSILVLIVACWACSGVAADPGAAREAAIEKLGGKLEYRDHPLTGQWEDHRDCHVRPDLVLIYRLPDADTLQLVRLGSHSELGL